MSKYSFKSPHFIKSAIAAKEYPILRTSDGKEMIEIAIAGRSNVGKSSLLNHLFHSRNLVKTSSTPGKTQMLNFFTLDNRLAFVDLPGYGYAKVPLAMRKRWGPMIQEYLDRRSSLKLLLFLFDIRRLPSEEDFLFLDWVATRQKALILVLTKVDKVNKGEKIINTQKILEAFNCKNLHYAYYSTTKNIGRKELVAMIHDALEDEQS
jgi:GTP-binding protein